MKHLAMVLLVGLVLATNAPTAAGKGGGPDQGARKACALNVAIDTRMFDRGVIVDQTDYVRLRKVLAKSRADGAKQIRQALSTPTVIEKEQARLDLADWCADRGI